MNRDIISYLICPDCKSDKLTLEEYSYSGNFIAEGRIICLSCGSWYRIENGLPVLIPVELQGEGLYEKFAVRHKLNLVNTGRRPDLTNKQEQINFYKEYVNGYEKDVVNNNYYQALDRVTFLDWMERELRDGQLVLDLGCGTARSCIPLGQHKIRTIGIDISEDMLLLAKKKIDRLGLNNHVTLIVADAQEPPVKDDSFDACIFYGILHHFSDPRAAIDNVSRKLVKGGLFYSLEPHKSPVRFIFDFMMRINRLYKEKASDRNLLFSEGQLKGWFFRSGVRGTTQLSTYLPPHLCHKLSVEINSRLLRASDSFFNRIAFLRGIAGVVIFKGIKT